MKFYCIYVILALFNVLGIEADILDDQRTIRNQCIKEGNMNIEETMIYIEGGMNTADLTDNIKCLYKCILEKPGHIKEGKLDDAAVMQSIEIYPELKEYAGELAKAIGRCKHIEGTDDCDTAYKIVMCFRDYESGI